MFKLSEAATALSAKLIGPDIAVTGVTTDSRAIAQGDLFVALRGERFDGHAFVDKALADGAVAALVSDAGSVTVKNASLLVVADTKVALGQLGAWWRDKFAGLIAGVTGSNGKTTVKEMLASILRGVAGENAVLATKGNLNNDIGVPLTLLRMRSDHRFAVIEMGMNHLLEISYLTRLTRPHVAVINNAGTAHIGELGSRENIAKAKGEIFEGLSDTGTKIINADDRFAAYWHTLSPYTRTIEFAIEHPADVRGVAKVGETGSVVEIETPKGSGVAHIHTPGLHNVRNALAAAATAYALGVGVEQIAAGLSTYQGTAGRLRRMSGPNGSTLVDDSYNANPDSMKAAIDWLARIPGQRVLVIGDMGELGSDEITMHTEVGAYAKTLALDALLAIGPLSAHAVTAFGGAGRHFDDMAKLIDAVKALCNTHTTIVVKASRSARMERVIVGLVGAQELGGSH